MQRSRLNCFLTRCYKRNYISSHINIYSLLERSDRTIFNRIRKRTNHPLREICPKTKPYTLKLRKQEAQWPIQFPQNVLNIVLLIDVFLSITYLCNYFNYIRTCNYWYVFYQLTIKALLLLLSDFQMLHACMIKY